VSRIKDKFSRRKTPSTSSTSSSSSYPKQQWGSSSGSSAGSSYPKQQYGSAGTAAVGAGAGGLAGGLAGSSVGSYPKQSYGSNIPGAPPSYGSAVGGGYPKQTYGNNMPGAPPAYNTAVGGGGFANPGQNTFGSNTPIGGGGFVNPSQNKFGSNTGMGAGGFANSGSHNTMGGGFMNTGNKPSSSWGSNVAAGGLGAAGGLAAGSYANKYKYPKSSWFSSVTKSKPSYKPGYGTAWGTNFGSGHMYKKKSGISKKALGLGVAAGFVGGAALGVAGTMATYSVYHRYQEFKNMMRMRGFGYGDDDMGWGNSYRRNECQYGCPMNSHCEWGYCECDYGFWRRYGQCVRKGGNYNPRPGSFNPFISCASYADCQAIDINMMCNTNLTVQTGGKCQCKPDMKWNEASGECQMFLDVDCSSITYETPPSKIILDAVSKAQANNISAGPPDELGDINATPSIEQSLNSSLLSQLDSKAATANEIKEAYCRDIDAFSFDFDVDPQRPPRCDPVPSQACGIVYDSHSCSGGWKLIITQGEISFPYFSSYWKYRNDIDLIGVKAGCTLTGYSDTGYSGRKGTFKAPENSEFWWVLEDYAEFQHLDSDIESIQCVCTNL